MWILLCLVTLWWIISVTFLSILMVQWRFVRPLINLLVVVIHFTILTILKELGRYCLKKQCAKSLQSWPILNNRGVGDDPYQAFPTKWQSPSRQWPIFGPQTSSILFFWSIYKGKAFCIFSNYCIEERFLFAHYVQRRHFTDSLHLDFFPLEFLRSCSRFHDSHSFRIYSLIFSRLS